MKRSTAAGLPAFILALAGALPADVVVSVEGRLEGVAVLRAEGIEVTVASGPRLVSWDAVIAWSGTGDPPLDAGPQALRLPGGEVWQVDLASVRAGKARFSSPILGEKEVDAARLAGVDFVPGLPPGSRPGLLERERGEAMPGTITWIDRDRLAIQGPLGPVILKREGLARYTFPPASGRAEGRDPVGTPESAPVPDEAALSDGTILRGKLSVLPDASGLALDHPVLGRVALPRAALRSVSRSPAGVVDLTGVSPRSAARLPLIASPPPEPAVEAIRGSPAFARGLRIEARADVRFALPPGEGRRLRVLVGPAAGSRGAVRLKISAGDTSVLDEEIGADAPPRPMDLELPPAPDDRPSPGSSAADELRIEVDPGAVIRFPAAVALGDPHVVVERGATRT